VANHKSALKRARQSNKRNLRNRAGRSALRTAIKKFRASLEGEDKVAETELHKIMSLVHGAGSKGLIKTQTASRTVSRLAQAWHKQSV